MNKPNNIIIIAMQNYFQGAQAVLYLKDLAIYITDVSSNIYHNDEMLL